MFKTKLKKWKQHRTNQFIIVENGVEKNVRKIEGLFFEMKGSNNTVKIEMPCSFFNSKIEMDGDNNTISIGRTEIGFRKLFILVGQNGNNKRLTIGKNCSCEELTIYLHDHNSSIDIGNNCMFSHGCFIQASDSHAVLDMKTHEMINKGHQIVLGDNIWVSQGVTILKNVKIADNTVIATKALVTKNIEKPNTIVGGVPAKQMKSGYYWLRHGPNELPVVPEQQITFVVQGAIDEVWTQKCLKSIRQHFSSSHIILSTWENSDLTSVNELYNEIILNKDPKSIKFSQRKKCPTIFNLDRQIVSSLNGLKAVKTKYAMKIRSDMIIQNRSILNYFNQFNNFDATFKLVEKRIVSFAAYAPITPTGERSWDFCMHDFGYFGLTADLLLLWDIPTMSESEKYYWKNKKYPALPNNAAPFMKDFIGFELNYQYHAEQYIMLKMFSKLKNIKINLEHMFDVKDENKELFQKLWVNNFVPLYANRLGISLPKDSYTYNTLKYSSSLDYTYCEFLALYNKYANGNKELPKKDKERFFWNKIKIKAKIYKFLHFYWLRGKK